MKEPCDPMTSNANQLDREAMRQAKLDMGGTAWPTILLAAGVVAFYVLNFVAVAQGRLSLLAGFFVSGNLVYPSYTILHETLHSNISGFGQPTRSYNEALGYAAGFIMTIPLTIHRVNHLTHHRTTNDPENDPDMVMAIEGRPGLISLLVVSLRGILKQYTFFLGPAWPTTTKLSLIHI